MKTEQIIEELKKASAQLGIEVRMGKGNFRGGRCIVGDEEIIMLNKRHLPEANLVILAESLRDLPIETVFLRPAVRSALEEVWQRNETLRVDTADGDE
ncbi:MAG: hypothetical protein WED81_06030 [Rhodothermales bacterium]